MQQLSKAGAAAGTMQGQPAAKSVQATASSAGPEAPIGEAPGWGQVGNQNGSQTGQLRAGALGLSQNRAEVLRSSRLSRGRGTDIPVLEPREGFTVLQTGVNCAMADEGGRLQNRRN